ncbi:MAG: hypothetical protein JNL42_23040 [Anaerolineae bacterium]|nr:hypothetical protein [Anaerolineae bacterium]
MLTASSVQEPAIFQVDREHTGLRLAILASFVGVWLVVFVLISTLLAAEGPALIAVLVGFGAAYLVTHYLERYLKGVWHSGRSIQVSSAGVELALKGAQQAQILSEDPARPLMWRFVISRRARIPKGWSMFACALTAEGQYLCAYTFMPPDKSDAYPRQGSFSRLEPKKPRTLRDDGREDLRLAGEQKRLREAESMRWVAGAEMTPEDFIAFVDLLYTRFPEWMPAEK